MAKFKFSYERILDLKQKEKESAQTQMSHAIKNQVRIEGKVLSISEKLEEVESLWESKQEKALVTDLISMANYVQALRSSLKREQQSLQIAKINVEKKQEDLRDKLKEENIWSSLKEKAEETYMTEMKWQEQLIQDETAVTRFLFTGVRGEEVGGK